MNDNCWLSVMNVPHWVRLSQTESDSVQFMKRWNEMGASLIGSGWQRTGCETKVWCCWEWCVTGTSDSFHFDWEIWCEDFRIQAQLLIAIQLIVCYPTPQHQMSESTALSMVPSWDMTDYCKRIKTCFVWEHVVFWCFSCFWPSEDSGASNQQTAVLEGRQNWRNRMKRAVEQYSALFVVTLAYSKDCFKWRKAYCWFYLQSFSTRWETHKLFYFASIAFLLVSPFKTQMNVNLLKRLY